ncbi:MAG TPA: DNA-deoxyinosine glycosylase [Burkholderiaceae bacterium]|nr:DNA-deoxyinosine glycosylase [Burkholderiaceae bacterium]
MVLTGLPPRVTPRTRLLVLGSFPGAASLAAGQYYAHPQNHFWKILRALLPPEPGGPGEDNYEARIQWMLAQGIGLWDVYAACERIGSLDTNIRNATVNDFALLQRRCPQLRAIAHNGGESFRHAGHTAALGVPVFKLPSSSPANASWSFARKRDAWREVFVAAGLVPKA